MDSAAHTRRTKNRRWQILLPLWVGSVVGFVILGILGETLLDDGLRDAARRQARTHASHIAAGLALQPDADQVGELQRRLCEVVAHSGIVAIAVYQPDADLPGMSQLVVERAGNSPLTQLPMHIEPPERGVELERRSSDGGGDLWLATVVVRRDDQDIGAVRVVTPAGHMVSSRVWFWTWGALITSMLVLGLTWWISHGTGSAERDVENVRRQIQAIVDGDFGVATALEAGPTGLQRPLTELARSVELTRSSAQDEVQTLRTNLADRSRLLEEAYLDMQSLDRAKETFLSNLSHEMRTPLTSIIAAEEILFNYADEDRASRHEFLEIIRQESRRLLNLIGKLLDLAKLEAKSLRLDLEQVDIGQLVEETTNAVFSQVRQKRVALTTTRATDHVLCECDRERISRVLHTLVENAFVYSPDNGSIRITVARDAAHAKITIEDDGANTMDRSVDMFDSATPAHADANGSLLGHAVARKLAHAHGGTLTRDQAADGGSVVELCLPLKQAGSLPYAQSDRPRATASASS